MSLTREERRLAQSLFFDGCYAALAGKDSDANPYRERRDPYAAACWDCGFLFLSGRDRQLDRPVRHADTRGRRRVSATAVSCVICGDALTALRGDELAEDVGEPSAPGVRSTDRRHRLIDRKRRELDQQEQRVDRRLPNEPDEHERDDSLNRFPIRRLATMTSSSSSAISPTSRCGRSCSRTSPCSRPPPSMSSPAARASAKAPGSPTRRPQTRGELGEKRRVIWIALGEDSYEIDVLPRIIAAEGDPQLVKYLRARPAAPPRQHPGAAEVRTRPRRCRPDHHRPARRRHRRPQHQPRRRRPPRHRPAEPPRRPARLRRDRRPTHNQQRSQGRIARRPPRLQRLGERPQGRPRARPRRQRRRPPTHPGRRG